MKNNFIAVLASGSKSNCTILNLNSTIILIDIGITYTKLKERCMAENIDYKKIKYLLITHEHIDHIRGLKQLMKNHPDIIIVCNKKTSRHLDLQGNLHYINVEQTLFIDKFKIKCYNLSHDAIDPINYIIENNHNKIGFIVDTGYLPKKWHKLFDDVNCLMIEFNHDIKKIMQSAYPFSVKQRIISDHGHLSNEQAIVLINQLKIRHDATIIAAHISENTNDPSIISELLKKNKTKYFHVALQEVGCPKIFLKE